MNNFHQIEKTFEYLLADAKERLASNEILEIQRFIDVGEYGLALETAMGIYIEENKEPSLKSIELIQTLGQMMDFDKLPQPFAGEANGSGLA